MRLISGVDLELCDWLGEEPYCLNIYEQVCAYHIRLLY